MLHDIIVLYTSLLRAAFLPASLARLEPRHIGHSESPRTAWKDQKQDAHLAWLPLCVRQVRCVCLVVGDLTVCLQSGAASVYIQSIHSFIHSFIHLFKNSTHKGIHWIPSKSRLWLYFNVFLTLTRHNDAVLLFFLQNVHQCAAAGCKSIQVEFWILNAFVAQKVAIFARKKIAKLHH